MKKTVVLIFGGASSEHEVSVNSAKNVFNAIDKNIYDVVLVAITKQGTWFKISQSDWNLKSAFVDQDMKSFDPVILASYLGQPMLVSFQSGEKQKVDCVFPIVHGTNGEDGTLQGLFRLVNVPFVGCDVLSSALCMDKEYMKIVLTQAGIPNSKYITLYKNHNLEFHFIEKQLGLPFFIKPANAGSSVGVHKIKSESDFKNKIVDAFKYDHKVIAEQFIAGQEIECSVMGLNNNPQASVPGELVVKHEFYSYEAKYLDENGAEIVIPARIAEEKIDEIRKMAIQSYQALGCDGLARVDFFLQQNGQLVVNELNTLPGFTKISMYPKMWDATGLKYRDLVSKLIQLAFDKHKYDSTKILNYIDSV